MSDFDRELADAVADEAALRRRQRRAEDELGRSELSARSVLASHVERGSRCAIHLRGGEVRHGTLTRLGADFVLLADGSRHRLISTNAIEKIVDAGEPHSGRSSDARRSVVTLADVLSEWALERRDATLSTTTTSTHGTLLGCGTDIAWITTDDRSTTAYVLLDSLTEASSST